jgi:hypothetical protein
MKLTSLHRAVVHYGYPVRAAGRPTRLKKKRIEQTLMRRKKLVLLSSAAVLLCRPTFAAPNPEREAYHGETHLHTSWSFDAYIFGNRPTGPADAYK